MYKIGNLRKGEKGIRVDRSSGSPLGNPFYLADANNDKQRKAVIDSFRAWFIKHKEDLKVKEELDRIRLLHEKGDVTLICWCSPKPCHAEVIRDFLMGKEI